MNEKNILIAPSILSADFCRLGEEVRDVIRAGADAIHVDVMDGHFVPNITIGPLVVEALSRFTMTPLDVHLMISDADRYIDLFADAGAAWITVHVEACTHLHRTVTRIKQLGKKAGVVLNPATPLASLDHILEEVDLVMLMSVNPGFGGQHFIASTLAKVWQLRQRIDALGLDVDIEVDGGISPLTIADVAEAGAIIFVAGSSVFGSDDYEEIIRKLREKGTAGASRYR